MAQRSQQEEAARDDAGTGRPATAPTVNERTTLLGGSGTSPTAPTAPGDAAPEGDDDAAADADHLNQKILKHLRAHDAAQDKAAASGDPLIGAEVGGRFTVVAKIGEGGMGAVYRARQKNMDRDVAIKVLLDDMSQNATVLRRFSLEALAVSKLKHPNTIQIFDFGETETGQLYIAMEFLDGEALADALKRHGALAARRALSITIQVAKSLREAHSKGIVHRDLKPDNIFLTRVGDERDFVKVLDFGVAKLREGDERQGTLTKAGAVFGTPRYMSPEQGMSAGSVDARSDLYAIGVILYEMLTGRAPFDADTALGILVQHVQEEVPPMLSMRPDLVIPPEVELFTRRLLQKDPQDRPQTAEALIREAEGLLGALDEIYRNVVTSELAEKIGLEVARPAPTQANTQLVGGARGSAPTVAGLSQETVYNEEAPRRRRWGLWAAASAVVVLVGGAGAAWAALAPLPNTYRHDGRLALLGDAGPGTGLAGAPAAGEVPRIPNVHVELTTSPPGAEVWRAGERVGTTPYKETTIRDPGRAATYVFKRDGYRDAQQQVRFDADVRAAVTLESLTPKVVAPVAAPPAAPKPVATSRAHGTRKAKAKPKPPADPKPVAAAPKPTPAKPKPKPKRGFGKIGDLKSGF